MSAARRWMRLLLARARDRVDGRGRDGRPDVRDDAARHLASMTRALGLADRLQQSLDASGAQVVIVARAGQDSAQVRPELVAPGVRLPRRHARTARRPPTARRDRSARPTPRCTAGVPAAAPDRAAPGASCTSSTSAAPRRPPSSGRASPSSSWTRRIRYEAEYVVPNPEVQAALMQVLGDDQRLVQWHTPAYSVVAYPWSTRYQQSNQWALETLAGALDPAADDARARAGLAAAARLPADRAAHRRAHAPGRAHDPGQCRLRRPSQREALQRPHRDGDRRIDVRLDAAHADRRPADARALTRAKPRSMTGIAAGDDPRAAATVDPTSRAAPPEQRSTSHLHEPIPSQPVRAPRANAASPRSSGRSSSAPPTTTS